MPELPEIETLVRDLRPIMDGRAVVDIECRQPKALNLPLDEFRRLARGPVGEVFRRAKSVVLALPGGTLWVHLGLGGRVVHAAVRAKEAAFGFALDDGTWLLVERTFMGHAHYASVADLSDRMAALGPEPLEVPVEQLARIINSARSLNLKALLMDQGRIAGIGNVYSDEILHRVNIHPGRRASELAAEATESLARTIPVVLEEAVAARGEPGFVSVNGLPGGYRMRIHRQAECGVCGAAAQKLSLAGRTAYCCPRCQPE